ncbi:MAG: hypothetical protein ABI467_09965 [Kofleriaceae bacterium]
MDRLARLVVVVVGVLVLAACSNDAHHMTTVDVDAPGMGSGSSHVDAPPQQGGPNVVDLQVSGDPDLIEYRDGSGPWIVPVLAGQAYELHVTDAYQVVLACSSTGVAGNEDSEQLDATFGDGAHQFMFCQSGGTTTPPATLAVTGQMQQAGKVMFGGVTKSGTTSPWSFSLAVAMGPHDLVAFDATKMQITRDIAVDAAVALPAVDVGANGTAYTNATLSLTGLATGETVQSESLLFTDNDYAQLSQTTDTSVVLAPAALLGQHDFTELDAKVTNMAAGTFRSVWAYDNTTTAFTLPPVLSGVTFGTAVPITAQWGTLPDVSTVVLEADAFTNTNFTVQRVTATQAWLTKAGATSLAFASDAANYDPSWNVTPAGAYLLFEVETDSQIGAAVSGLEISPQPARSTARLQQALLARVHQAAHRVRVVASGNKHVRSL